MKTILDGLFLNKRGTKAKVNPVCSLVFYCFLVLTIITSCTAAYMSSKGVINKSLFVYKFARYEENKEIPDGTPVSINWDGQLVKGGGYGIYRTASTTAAKELTNVKIQTIGDNVVVAVSNGQVSLMHIQSAEEGKTTEDDRFTIEIDSVSHFKQLSNEYFVVCGRKQFQPLRIRYSIEGGKVKYQYKKGAVLTAVPSTGDFAHVDTLDETTIGFTYENKDENEIKTIRGNIARLVGSDDNFSLQLGTDTMVNEDGVYAFHGVAGMDKNHMVLHVNGRRDNGTEPHGWEPMPMRMKLITINDDGSIVPDEGWVWRIFTDSSTWFAADNFPNRNSGIVAFYDDAHHGGVVAIEFSMRSTTSSGTTKWTLSWGPTLVCESGGAKPASGGQRIALRMLSHRQFGLIFPDENANGALIHMMGELTANGDLIRVGPNFRIRGRRQGAGRFYFDLDALDRYGHYIILDSFTSADDISYASLSYGFNLGRPMGIVVSRTGKKENVQFAGVYSYDKKKVKFTPGRVYYTNSKGELVEGRRMFGADHVESGNFYYADDKQILSLHNQIGVAVSAHELLIRLR